MLRAEIHELGILRGHLVLEETGGGSQLLRLGGREGLQPSCGAPSTEDRFCHDSPVMLWPDSDPM